MPEKILALLIACAVVVATLQILFLILRAGYRSLVKTPVAPSNTEDWTTLDLLPMASSDVLFPTQEKVLRSLESQRPAALSIVCPHPDAPVGLGLTQVSVAFVHRNREHYRAVFFVSADTPQRLRHVFAGLAGPSTLDLEGYGDARDEEERAELVLRWMGARADWLLLIDGADREEAVAAVETFRLRLPPGRVVITSRSRAWSEKGSRVFLEAPSPEDAALFLLRQTESGRQRTDEDPAEAEALAKALGCAPLTLELAVAWIVAQRVSLADYRKRLREPGAQPTGLAMLALPPQARDVAKLLATLAPGAIPRLVIARYLADASGEGKEIEPQQVLAALQSYGLGTYRGADSGRQDSGGEDFDLAALEGETFWMHGRIQELIRNSFETGEEAQWIVAAATTLAGIFPEPAWDPASWPEWETLAPHALRVEDAARRLPPEDANTYIAAFFSQLSSFLYARGLPEEAESPARKALAVHRSQLFLLSLADICRSLEHFSEAIELCREAQAKDQRDPEISALERTHTTAHLASALSESKEFPEAESLYRQVLETYQQEFEPDDPNIAHTLSELAWTVESQSRLKEAERLREDALALFKEATGPDSDQVRWEQEDLAELREKIWQQG